MTGAWEDGELAVRFDGCEFTEDQCSPNDLEVITGPGSGGYRPTDAERRASALRAAGWTGPIDPDGHAIHGEPKWAGLAGVLTAIEQEATDPASCCRCVLDPDQPQWDQVADCRCVVGQGADRASCTCGPWDLDLAIREDDEAEDRGDIDGDGRATCHRCQDWADHAHRPFSGERISVATYGLESLLRQHPSLRDHMDRLAQHSTGQGSAAPQSPARHYMDDPPGGGLPGCDPGAHTWDGYGWCTTCGVERSPDGITYPLVPDGPTPCHRPGCPGSLITEGDPHFDADGGASISTRCDTCGISSGRSWTWSTEPGLLPGRHGSDSDRPLESPVGHPAGGQDPTTPDGATNQHEHDQEEGMSTGTTDMTITSGAGGTTVTGVSQMGQQLTAVGDLRAEVAELRKVSEISIQTLQALEAWAAGLPDQVAAADWGTEAVTAAAVGLSEARTVDEVRSGITTLLQAAAEAERLGEQLAAGGAHKGVAGLRPQ